MTDQEIKDLKDGVPNYPGRFVEVEGPTPPHEYLCGECTGSGIMLGFYPCKPCAGTGYIVSDWKRYAEIYFKGERDIDKYKESMGLNKATDSIYPNERELKLLNDRIATLKAQLSKELQLKKSERNQRDIKELQQSINTLTKWKKKK